MNTVAISALAFSIFTALLTGWNTYHNQRIGRIVAEMQLNIMNTFNGRYIRVDSFNDAKARIARLEEQHDKELNGRVKDLGLRNS